MPETRPRRAVAVANARQKKKAKCVECGTEFARFRSTQKHCSSKCRWKSWDSRHPRAPLLAIAEGYVADRPAPTDPKARRDRGKRIAAANHKWEIAQAQELALELIGTKGPSIISDLRVFAQDRGVSLPWHQSWVANIFRRPWFEATGERRATYHEAGNARKVNVYRLTGEGMRKFHERRRNYGNP